MVNGMKVVGKTSPFAGHPMVGVLLEQGRAGFEYSCWAEQEFNITGRTRWSAVRLVRHNGNDVGPEPAAFCADVGGGEADPHLGYGRRIGSLAVWVSHTMASEGAPNGEGTDRF
jgi:hypothetical protein